MAISVFFFQYTLGIVWFEYVSVSNSTHIPCVFTLKLKFFHQIACIDINIFPFTFFSLFFHLLCVASKWLTRSHFPKSINGTFMIKILEEKFAYMREFFAILGNVKRRMRIFFGWWWLTGSFVAIIIIWWYFSAFVHSTHFVSWF